MVSEILLTATRSYYYRPVIRLKAHLDCKYSRDTHSMEDRVTTMHISKTHSQKINSSNQGPFSSFYHILLVLKLNSESLNGFNHLCKGQSS